MKSEGKRLRVITLLKVFVSLMLLGAARAYSTTRVITFWRDTAIVGGNIDVPADLTNAVAIADAGEYGYDRLAVTLDQRPIYWGTSIGSPFGWSHIVAIACGGQNLELQSDGSVRFWLPDLHGSGAVAGLSNVVAIAAGRNVNLALIADGTVVSWGTPNGAPNIVVPKGLSNIVAIAAGSDHALALRADGNVVAWGGIGNGGEAIVPRDLANVVRIAAGNHHSLALKADGTLVAWGTYGSRMGTYFGLTLEVPVTVPPDLTNVAAMIGGEYYTLALRTDGTIVEWGAAGSSVSYIPAGTRVTNPERIPIIVPPGLTNVMAISHGLALIGDAQPVLGLLQAPITDVILDATGFHCSIPTESGRVYRLESKDSLNQTSWTALPLIAGTGRSIALTDAAMPGTQRIYHVRRW
jgi:alpha-tubulin suppressor-like RCC1 family protein